MQPKLFVGNLSYNVTESELETLFAQHGEVRSINIIRDQYSGQSKGFAFVEMASSQDAEKALALNGTDLQGRNLNVSEARPPQKKSFGGGGGRGRGGYGGGGGGGHKKGGFRGGYGGGGGRDRW
ncbi:MAG: RNA-binding protein [Candidatus Omnitrophica bacterium]|nr:RNA-binding protein [Candidatus Omnitrophota bacterium]